MWLWTVSEGRVPPGVWQTFLPVREVYHVCQVGDTLIATGYNGLILYEAKSGTVSLRVAPVIYGQRIVQTVCVRGEGVVLAFADGTIQTYRKGATEVSFDFALQREWTPPKVYSGVWCEACGDGEVLLGLRGGLLRVRPFPLLVIGWFPSKGNAIVRRVVATPSYVFALEGYRIAYFSVNWYPPVDSSDWQWLPFDSVQDLTRFGDSVCILAGDTLWVGVPGVWRAVPLPGRGKRFLASGDQSVWILGVQNGSEVWWHWTRTFTPYSAYTGDPRHLLESRWETGIWIADGSQGLVHVDPARGTIDPIVFDGPAYLSCGGVSTGQDTLVLLPGGASPLRDSLIMRPAILSLYHDGKWWTLDLRNNLDKSVITSGAWDEVRRWLWLGTWGQGVYAFTLEGELRMRLGPNQLPFTISGNDSLVFISDVFVDGEGRVWLGLWGNGVYVWREGDIYPVFQEGNVRVAQIGVFDRHLWVLTGNQRGVYLVSFGDPFVDTDDQIRHLREDQGVGNLGSAIPLAWAADPLSQTVYIGTANWVRLFQCTDWLDPACEGKPLFIAGEGEPLFPQNAWVWALALAPDQSLWAGTLQSLLVVDRRGNLQHKWEMFPLPFPVPPPWKILVVPGSGEVVWLSPSGLAMYGGESTLPGEACQEMMVYPNPVQLARGLPVMFSGLPADAQIRITTAEGMPVYRAYGRAGGFQWNLQDVSGQVVAPGVYLVYVTGKMDGRTRTCLLRVVVLDE